MKKILILTFLLSIFCVKTMVAQVKIVCSAPGVEVKYKRALVRGNIATVHFTLTNLTGTDLTSYLESSESTRSEVQKAEAFDDEGNYYSVASGKMTVGVVDALITGSNQSRRFSFPNEITIKGVVTINNVDEYATSLTRVAIPFRNFNTTNEPYGVGYIIFKDIPLSKER